MRYSVDRITDGVAVLVSDDGGSRPVPAAQLPENIRSGTVLRLDADGSWHADSKETLSRRKKASMLFHRLKARGQKD